MGLLDENFAEIHRIYDTKVLLCLRKIYRHKRQCSFYFCQCVICDRESVTNYMSQESLRKMSALSLNIPFIFKNLGYKLDISRVFRK